MQTFQEFGFPAERQDGDSTGLDGREIDVVKTGGGADDGLQPTARRQNIFVYVMAEPGDEDVVTFERVDQFGAVERLIGERSWPHVGTLASGQVSV